MTRLSTLPTTTAVPRSTTHEFPVLAILGGPGVEPEDAYTLRPHYNHGQIDGYNLFLPPDMTASEQLDKIEAAVAELRRHIAPDGSLLRDRVPPEAPLTPQLALVPAQRQGSER